jgi:hypothetical protein
MWLYFILVWVVAVGRLMLITTGALVDTAPPLSYAFAVIECAPAGTSVVNPLMV